MRMPQNRSDTIKRFIGIASNVVIHRVLLQSALSEESKKYYEREISRDIAIASTYRDQINPRDRPPSDATEIKNRILKNVTNELQNRKQKGYDVEMQLIVLEAEDFLNRLKIT